MTIEVVETEGKKTIYVSGDDIAFEDVHHGGAILIGARDAIKVGRHRRRYIDWSRVRYILPVPHRLEEDE